MRRRAYTILELMVILIILAILSTIAVTSYGGVFSHDTDAPVQATLRGLAAEEDSYYQTYGSFASSLTTLSGLEPNYTYVANATASSGPTVVSVAVGTVSGVAAVGLAMVGASGYCNVLNTEAPSSSRADVTDRFAVVGSNCTGAAALSDTTPGDPW